jgi:hypothetical protein
MTISTANAEFNRIGKEATRRALRDACRTGNSEACQALGQATVDGGQVPPGNAPNAPLKPTLKYCEKLPHKCRGQSKGGKGNESSNRPTDSGPDVSGQNADLTFDGTALTMLDERGNAIGSWSGVSGREGYWDARYQGVHDAGPIPEGYYVVLQSELQRRPTSTWEVLKQSMGRGTWPGGNRSWGDWRVWLTPASGTNTHGRSGFTIHGGIVPGSAGCIDLCGEMPAFVEMFQQQGHDMILRVQYPQ